MLLVHFKSAADHGEQERRRLAGASLSTSHEVAARDGDRNRVLLHGCGLGITHLLDAVTDGIQPGMIEVFKFGNRVAAADLNRNVEVLLKVDALALALHLEEALDLGIFLRLNTLTR